MIPSHTADKYSMHLKTLRSVPVAKDPDQQATTHTPAPNARDHLPTGHHAAQLRKISKKMWRRHRMHPRMQRRSRGRCWALPTLVLVIMAERQKKGGGMVAIGKRRRTCGARSGRLPVDLDRGRLWLWQRGRRWGSLLDKVRRSALTRLGLPPTCMSGRRLASLLINGRCGTTTLPYYTTSA